MEKLDRKKIGKESRILGKDFEVRVRADLEEKGWIVNRWSNDIDFKKDKLVPSKPKFFFDIKTKKMKMMGMRDGCPDFLAFKFYKGYNGIKSYEIIGVESKINGILDKLEKDKFKWLIKNNVFSKILFTKRVKEKNRIKIVYTEFG